MLEANEGLEKIFVVRKVGICEDEYCERRQ